MTSLNLRLIKLLSIVLFISFILLLAGCGNSSSSGSTSETKCKASSDCQKGGKCFKYSCKENKCVKETTPNCCGNGVCESAKGESYCSCQEDCGKNKCEGKILLDPKYKTYSKYLQYMCNQNNECFADYNRTLQRNVAMQVEKQLTHFNVYINTLIKKPFDITKDTVEIEMELKDISDDVFGPIKITKIQSLKSGYVFASQDISRNLTKIGDSFAISLPFTYEPENNEEEKSLDIKIDYSYTYYTDKKNGITKDKKGESITYSLAEKIVIIKPGAKK